MSKTLSEMAHEELKLLQERVLLQGIEVDINAEDFAPLCLYLHHQAGQIFTTWKESPEVSLVTRDEKQAVLSGVPVDVARLALAALGVLVRMGFDRDGLYELLESTLALEARELKEEADMIATYLADQKRDKHT